MKTNNDKTSLTGVILLILMVLVLFALGFYVLNLFCECISQETVESLINQYFR